MSCVVRGQPCQRYYLCKKPRCSRRKQFRLNGHQLLCKACSVNRHEQSCNDKNWFPKALAVSTIVVTIALNAHAQQETINEIYQQCSLLDSAETEAFTLYGSSFKKYVIEKLEGEKVISRRKGFTVETCSTAVKSSQETPQFQGLNTGQKVQYAGNLQCVRVAGEDLKNVCAKACEKSCSVTLEKYEQDLVQDAGLGLDSKDYNRMTKVCQRNCGYECTKPGKAFDFVAPFRK